MVVWKKGFKYGYSLRGVEGSFIFTNSRLGCLLLRGLLSKKKGEGTFCVCVNT